LHLLLFFNDGNNLCIYCYFSFFITFCFFIHENAHQKISNFQRARFVSNS